MNENAKRRRREGMPLQGKDVREVTPRGRSKLRRAKAQIELAIREENARADSRISGAGKRYWGAEAEPLPEFLKHETTDEEVNHAAESLSDLA